MTNDVFCIGLTKTELQTLRVLLPTTFPILTTEPDALDEAMIEHIAEQASRKQTSCADSPVFRQYDAPAAS